MGTTAFQNTDMQERAVEALLKGFGIRGAATLPVLRRLAEKVAVTNENDAFERVRLRSIGVGNDTLAEEGGALSDAEFAKRLNVRSRQTIHNYREAGKIFAVSSGARNFVYPALQIHKGALLPGLAEVSRILNDSQTAPMGILLFFLTPAEALEDERPLDLLRKGEIEGVLRHAKRYDVIGS